MKLKRIISIARHRNGVGGAPFDIVLFTDRGKSASRKLAILFEIESCCAVFDVDKLAAGDIAFGSNSWRGDEYEPSLRQAVADHWRRALSTDDGQEPPALIDIHRLLRARRQVAVIWCVDDVRNIRSDLSDDQAWQVLRRCYEKHACDDGVTAATLETTAAELFPDEPSTKEE